MSKKYNREDGKALVEAQLSSGLNGSAYCRKNSVSYDVLKYWYRQLGYTKQHRMTYQKEIEWAKIQAPVGTEQEPDTRRVITVKISNIRVEIPLGSIRKDISEVLGAVLEIC